MEVVSVLMTDKTDAISIENATAVKSLFFIVINYHQVKLCLKIEQIGDLNILLCDANLSHVISSRATLRMYDFNYY